MITAKKIHKNQTFSTSNTIFNWNEEIDNNNKIRIKHKTNIFNPNKKNVCRRANKSHGVWQA